MANKIEKQFLDTENKGPVRLNKYLSEAGVCSRREADKLIAAGQVTDKPRGIVCTEERRERDSIVRFLNYPVRITYV